MVLRLSKNWVKGSLKPEEHIAVALMIAEYAIWMIYQPFLSLSLSLTFFSSHLIIKQNLRIFLYYYPYKKPRKKQTTTKVLSINNTTNTIYYYLGRPKRSHSLNAWPLHYYHQKSTIFFDYAHILSLPGQLLLHVHFPIYSIT